MLPLKTNTSFDWYTSQWYNWYNCWHICQEHFIYFTCQTTKKNSSPFCILQIKLFIWYVSWNATCSDWFLYFSIGQNPNLIPPPQCYGVHYWFFQILHSANLGHGLAVGRHYFLLGILISLNDRQYFQKQQWKMQAPEISNVKLHQAKLYTWNERTPQHIAKILVKTLSALVKTHTWTVSSETL